MLAQPMLLFKYSELKMVYQKILACFPSLKENFPGVDKYQIPAKLAEQTMTMACHARRLKDPIRFAECTKSLAMWQVEKLENLKVELGRLHDDYEEEQNELVTGQQEAQTVRKKPSFRSSTPRSSPRPSLSSSSLQRGSSRKSLRSQSCDVDHDLQSLLDVEIPLAQDSNSESERSHGILKKAEETSPVPARKRNIREQIEESKGKGLKKKGKLGKKQGSNFVKKKKKESLQKAAKDEKKKGSPQKPAKDEKNKKRNRAPRKVHLTSAELGQLTLMPYKATKAVAVRIRNGQQLFQVSCYHDLKKNGKQAQKFLDELKAGKPLVKVLEIRDQMHPKTGK